MDLVAIYVYSQKALMPTAVLYTLFLFMAISGLIIWWCAWRTQVQANFLAKQSQAKMRRGLVLGKFAPLHRGHQFLIEHALAQVDKIGSDHLRLPRAD